MHWGRSGLGLVFAVGLALSLAPPASAMYVTFSGSGSHSETYVWHNAFITESTTRHITFNWNAVFGPGAAGYGVYEPSSFSLPPAATIDANSHQIVPRSSGSGVSYYLNVNTEADGTVSSQVGPCNDPFALDLEGTGAQAEVTRGATTTFLITLGQSPFQERPGACWPASDWWLGGFAYSYPGDSLPSDLRGEVPTTKIKLSTKDLSAPTVKRSVSSDIDQPSPLPTDCGNDLSNPPAECSQSYAWTGDVVVCNSTVSSTKFASAGPELQGKLAGLFAKFDQEGACYILSNTFRNRSEQQDLYDRWHQIADHNVNDPGTCAALHAAGFKQCPAGQTSSGVAKGGPAKPGSSRHEVHEAADITVVWPQNGYKEDLSRFRSASHSVGLCGPPAGDPVHVELPYQVKGAKKATCHFD
jgi:hypothetical protein